jgi:hypothetical protein
VTFDSSKVMVSIASGLPQNCFNLHSYVSGPAKFDSAVISGDGIVSFPELEVYCSPLGNLTISVNAQFGEEFGIAPENIDVYAVSQVTQLHFRDCVVGEYQKNGLCVECPENTYSLSINSAQCTDCSSTEGVQHCHGNQIVVESGYWRRHESSETVIACTYNTHGCLGGNLTGLSSCSTGL